MKAAPILLALALSGIHASLLPPSAAAADAFYTQLLARGVRDLELGLTEQAQEKLRTACFGFLDEPVLLAEGLMQLGRSQIKAGNLPELVETLERIVEIEDRFEAYSSFVAPLKPQFEDSLRLALPEATLARMALFSHLIIVTPPAIEAVRPPTRKERKRELERQLQSNPGDASTLLALAQVHYAGGKLRPAAALLDQLLAADAAHPQALCLRAYIAVARKECAPALAGLDSCPVLIETDPGMAHVLDCLVSDRRSADAMALLEALPADRRQAPLIVRAERGVSKSAESATMETSPTIGTDEKVVPEITIGFTLEERIRRLREKVSQTRFREQLEEAMQRAEELAADYPDSAQAQHLAAEVAYLSSDWQAVIDYSARGGPPSANRPELLFYLAVATFELGDPQEADSVLRRALPNLQRSTFVDSYIEKILLPPGS